MEHLYKKVSGLNLKCLSFKLNYCQNWGMNGSLTKYYPYGMNLLKIAKIAKWNYFLANTFNLLIVNYILIKNF